MHEVAQSVLDVWFEGTHAHTVDPNGPTRRWFVRDDRFDADLRARFGVALDHGARGELGSWIATPKGALAFVVLCDQIARNIHRDTARAFATDPLALHTCLGVLGAGEDTSLRIPERLFLLMPLMHSESLPVHDLARREFARLRKDAEASPFVAMAQGAVEFEEKHRAILERFGRYPHRNEPLGRASSAQELEFLKQPGSRF